MNKHIKSNLVYLLLIIASTFNLTAYATVQYVAPAGSSAWAGQTVYNDIASALAVAQVNDEIWVATGTYSIGVTMAVDKSLKIYGGFAGTETTIDERLKVVNGSEWEFQNPTILNMTAGVNCFTVSNSTTTATIDGLTIDGNNIVGTRGITGSGWTELFISRCIIKNNNISSGYGAGIIGKSKTTISYCLVDHNVSVKPASSSKWGGGICILGANSSITFSTIKNNSHTDSGGGIGVDNVAGVTISNCRITDNSTTNSGGGICGYVVDDIHNCWIENNTANNGGGIFCRAYSGSGNVYNSIIIGNTSITSGSGIVFGNSTTPQKVYNCLIINNKGGGGGVSFSNNTANHQLINCILFNNKNGTNVLNVVAAGTNNVFKNNILDTDNVTNLTQVSCIVETNPAKLFTNYDGGNYSLPESGFTGEDKGNATNLTFVDNKDYSGTLRVQGSEIEIGPYEITPTNIATLKSLKINGVQIDGFLSELTKYNVSLPSSFTTYPEITIEPTVSGATVSELTYNPVNFDSDGTNVVRFSVTNGDITTDYIINFTVNKMPELSDLILKRIREDKLTRDKTALEADIDVFLPKMQADGSFNDCHYVSEFRNDEAVLNHVIRLRELGIAYTQPENKYYQSDDIYAKIVKGFEFWYSKHWTDSNWWYNRIGHPQRLGEALIAMYGGKKDIRTEPIFASLVTRWKNEMGDPDSPNDATTAGANKCDIAMHWIYRSCLTLNEPDLAKAADRSFLIIEHTTGEGIQYDWSFLQHGAQLYIGGYGYQFIQLVTRQASYLAGTKYALGGDKLDILSQFVRNTFIPVIRGQRMSFSTLGRGVTRTNNTNQSGFTSILNLLKIVDTAHADEYDNATKRLTNVEAPSFNVPSNQTHFYCGEYTLQQRPAYTFDLRLASSRLKRSEYDINENKQGFFMSEGATGIYVDGEEYGSILPFWNWKKIPGTTLPDLATMRRADSYLFSGRSSFAGGVTDGKYGVTGYTMLNDQALFAYNDDDGYNGTPNNSGTRLPALNFGAKKSWYIFDKEIVCLGAGIYSAHDEPMFTTVNQCRQAGNVIVSSNNVDQTVNKGTYTYNNVDWVLNDKVAYFFPNKSELNVSNETKSGSWHDINNNGSSDVISGELFTLWLNHGVRPTNASYAYIIVPNVQDATQAKAYQASNIEILANTDSVQVVHHKELNQYGLTFFKGCSFKSEQLSIEASAGCVVLVKDADKDNLTVWVADPQKQGSPIKIGLKTPLLNEAKLLTYTNPASPHQGKSLSYTINNDSPKYGGKEVLLDRSDWIITCSSVGPVDDTVAPSGDYPKYIIDGDTKTSFLFVKPGVTYGNITVPAGEKPSFTIDLKQIKDMNFLVYRHRDYNNTSAALRINKASFYGKNTEDGEFQPIVLNFDMVTNVAEVHIDFTEKVSYRYVKFVMEGWDATSGSTIQTSEFNIGTVNLLGTNTISKKISPQQIHLFPNPIKAGNPFYIHLDNDFTDASVAIYTLAGVKISECKARGNAVELKIDKQGVYVIEVKKNSKLAVLKAIIK